MEVQSRHLQSQHLAGGGEVQDQGPEATGTEAHIESLVQ